MIQPDEKESIAKLPKQKPLRGFLIGFIGWFILNKVFIELQHVLLNPIGLLVDLAPVIVLIILFVKKKNWIGFGVVSAMIIQFVPILVYFYMGD